jgi:hypothetical protein
MRDIEKEVDGLSRDHSSFITAKAQEWLDEMEDIRYRSTNLNGLMSGKLKVLIGKTKGVVNVLSIWANTSGDPEYWRAELEGQKRENDDLRVKIDALEKVIQQYRNKKSMAGTISMISDPPSPSREDGGVAFSLGCDEDLYLPEEDVQNLPTHRPSLRGDINREGKLEKGKKDLREIDKGNDRHTDNLLRDNYKINLAVMRTLEGLNTAIENMSNNINNGFRLMVQEISKNREKEDNRKSGSRKVHAERNERMHLNKDINVKEREDNGKVLTYSDATK